MTITWHVDDLKLSHQSDAALTRVIEWLESIYGTLNPSRGDKHEYLGMSLDYSDPGKVKISMPQFTKDIIEEFPKDLPKMAELLADNYLFTIRDKDDPKRRPLPAGRAQTFHRLVVRLLFLVARPQRDCNTAVAFLAACALPPP